MGLMQTVAPTKLPLTLDEAKAHLKVDFDDEDALITSLIKSTRQMVEAYTMRQLITATFTLTLCDFPGGWGIIELPRTPAQSISSITYYDGDGTSTTLSTDYYELVKNDTVAWAVLKPGQSWPSVQSDKFEAVTVTFVAGYGDNPTSVPEPVRSAMLLLIGHLYEHREAVNVGNIVTEMPLTVAALLDTVAIRKVA